MCAGSKAKSSGSYCLSDTTIGSSSKEAGEDDMGNKDKFPVRPGITWRKGERVEAMDYLHEWYPAKIVDIDEAELSVLIHFEGWNQRYDEWVEMASDSLRPLTRHSERRCKYKKDRSGYKVGDQVLAKWTDCKMYMAKVDQVLNDGSYVVIFYDGFKKSIQPINMRPVPTNFRQQKFSFKPPNHSPRDVKKLKTKLLIDNKDQKPPTEEKKQKPPTEEKKQKPPTEEKKQKITKIKDKPNTCHLTEKPHRTHMGYHKRSKLIVAGSLFAKREKPSMPAISPKKNKVTKVKMEIIEEKKEEVEEKEKKVELPTETEEKVTGTEAGCQTEGTTPPAEIQAAKKKRSAGSFPPVPEKRKRRKRTSRLSSSPALIKKAKSADEEKTLESPVLSPSLLAPAPTVSPLPAIPPKAFIVEEDHNPFKCTVVGCRKGFRKASLLVSHTKYYHTEEGGPPTSPSAPRKRQKTSSMCSTDSDLSVSSKSHATKHQRHVSDISVTGSPDLALRMSFEEEDVSNTSRQPDPILTEEPLAATETEDEQPEEVVHCVCGINEENGLMIQCEVCMCWQHAKCFNIHNDMTKDFYVCFVCKHPQGVRDSCQHWYDTDWFKKGRLPSFTFLGQEPREEKQSQVQLTHSLMAEVRRAQKVLHGLREELWVSGEKDHPELQLWNRTFPKETCSVGVSTSDADIVSTPVLYSQKMKDGTTPHLRIKSEDSDIAGEQVADRHHKITSQISIKAENTESQTNMQGQYSSVANSTGTLDSGKMETVHHSDERASQDIVNKPLADRKISEDSDINKMHTDVSHLHNENTTNSQVDILNNMAKPEDKIILDSTNVNNSERSTSNIAIQMKSSVKKELMDEQKEEGDIATGTWTPTVQKDSLVASKMTMLRYVRNLQDEVSHVLDDLDRKITDLERQELGSEAPAVSSSIPILKHSLYRIARDLNKVKGISTFH